MTSRMTHHVYTTSHPRTSTRNTSTCSVHASPVVMARSSLASACPSGACVSHTSSHSRHTKMCSAYTI